MSASLTDQLFQQLQGAPLAQISQQLGIAPAQAEHAVGAALPLLLGALGRNAASPQGAADLFGALQRDHAGGPDLGSVLGSVLGGLGGGGAAAPQFDGGGILGHIFGDNQDRAGASLGQATGLGGAQAGSLLAILAPLVLSFLGKQVLGGGAAAAPAGGAGLAPGGSGIDVLGSILGREHANIQQQGGLGGGLLGSVLDQDGDGQLGLGDLLKVGASLLGGRR